MPKRVKLPPALEASEEAQPEPTPDPATPPTPLMEPNVEISIEEAPQPPEPEPEPEPIEAPKPKRPRSEKQIAVLAAAREKRAAMLREKKELEAKLNEPIKEPKPPKEPRAPKAPKLAKEPKLPKPRAPKVTPAKVSAAESKQIAEAKKMEFEARVARQVAHEMRKAKIIERLEAEEAAKAQVAMTPHHPQPQPGPSHEVAKPVLMPKTQREFTIDGEAVFLRNRRKQDDWLDHLLAYAK